MRFSTLWTRKSAKATAEIARWRRGALIAATFLIASSAVWFVRVEACGPFFDPEVFVAEHHPEKPSLYADGHLGILKTGYYHAELVIAYRYLSGGRLSDAEKAAYAPAMLASDDPYTWDEQQQKASKEAMDVWSTAYNRVVGEGLTPAVDPSRTVQNSDNPFQDQVLNCTNSAFLTAATTLTDRAKTWGADSAELKEWVRGQHAVFSNCSKAAEMPEAADPHWKLLLRQDRAYQIAAAEFYAQHFDEAIADFEAIARDTSSPWSRWGEYLAARGEVRKAAATPPPPAPVAAPGSPPAESPAFNLNGLRAAQTRLTRLLSQTRDPEIQHAATQELHLIEVRLAPSTRLDEAAQALAGPTPDADFAQDLADLDWLVGSTPATADLAVWVQHMQSTTPDKKAQASVEEWRSKHTLPWMVASMIHTPASVPEEMVRAAGEVSPQSPGYDTASYLRAQWMTGNQHNAEARALLTTMLGRLDEKATDSTRSGCISPVNREFNREILRFQTSFSAWHPGHAAQITAFKPIWRTIRP